jgi:hypothetical protein
MKAAIKATKGHFESSSFRTPEYLAWHRTFKRAFTKFLESRGMTGIEISKPNHFDLSGFFKDGGHDQIWYFRIEDIRWSKDRMLIRTAQHYKDYTGGRNQYVPLDGSDLDFKDSFDTVLKYEYTARFEKRVREQATMTS